MRGKQTVSCFATGVRYDDCSEFYKASHYALGMKPDLKAKWAHKTARNIPAILRKSFKEPVYPILCYTGYSGACHATALALALYNMDRDYPFGMMYIRKKSEAMTCHGLSRETSLNRVEHRKTILVFVDDKIASGATLKRVLHHSTAYLSTCYRVIEGMNTEKYIRALIDDTTLEHLSIEEPTDGDQ